MIRFFVLLSILYINLAATIINFKEEKYIAAIENSVYRIGKLEFLDNKIKLQYNNQDKILIYENDKLIMKNVDEIEEIDLSNQLVLKMIFELISSIYKNDLEFTDEYFTKEIKNKKIILSPKENIRQYLKVIEIKKAEKLEYINIEFKNGNKIKIEEIE